MRPGPRDGRSQCYITGDLGEVRKAWALDCKTKDSRKSVTRTNSITFQNNVKKKMAQRFGVLTALTVDPGSAPSEDIRLLTSTCNSGSTRLDPFF